MLEQEPKISEILEAIHDFADHTEKRLGIIDNRLENVENRVGSVETEIKQMRSDMVTKDYLDDKLADLRGDLVVLTRKEDRKLIALIDILKERKVITEDDAKKLTALEPFAQMI